MMMPSENQLKKAIAAVVGEMGLEEWQISTSSDNSLEDSYYSLKVSAIQKPYIHPHPHFVEVIFIGDKSQGNITNIPFNYGVTIEYSGDLMNAFDNHCESTMRSNTMIIQAMNSQTLITYEFMSKLIQKLSSPSHPEVS